MKHHGLTHGPSPITCIVTYINLFVIPNLFRYLLFQHLKTLKRVQGDNCRFGITLLSLFTWVLFSLCLINSPALAGWEIETVDTGTVGESTSLAFDASGKPAISYVGPNNLKYAHFNGSVWDITTVDEWAMEEGGATSLAFDTSGKPAISYYDLGDSVLKYASFNGAAWVITPVDSIDSASIREEGGATSLAFDASGNPAIAYSDDGDIHNGILKYAHFNGATWDITPIDPGGCVGEEISLAFDASGNPAISYTADCEGIGSDTDHLKYAHFNGATWDITTVDSGGDGSMDESSSLAFDSSGNPAIAYVRGISKKDSNIKYAHFNGATWDITTVGAGKDKYQYQSPSLAFDSSGNPAIAYVRGISKKDSNIKYAHFNGTTWDITTIDAGLEVSLAFDADGRPAIAYNNGLRNYDLKFARFVPCQCDAGSPMGCISGTVTKVGTGKPLAGKTVTLRRMSPKPRITLNATTGSDGCYSFTDLVNGTYKIKVSSCKDGGSKIKKITGGGKVNNVNFECR